MLTECSTPAPLPPHVLDTGEPWETPPTPRQTIWEVACLLAGQGWRSGPPPHLTAQELAADVELARALPCPCCGDPAPGYLLALHHPERGEYRAWRCCPLCRHAEQI